MSPQSDKCCKSDRENYAKSSPFLQTPYWCCLPKIPGFELWKYVDDSTISEKMLKGQVGNIQSAVDIFALRAASEKFQLNETPNFNPIVINDKQIDVVLRFLVWIFRAI